MTGRDYNDYSLKKALTIMGAVKQEAGNSTSKHHTRKTIQATFPDDKVLVVRTNGSVKERNVPSRKYL